MLIENLTLKSILSGNFVVIISVKLCLVNVIIINMFLNLVFSLSFYSFLITLQEFNFTIALFKSLSTSLKIFLNLCFSFFE